MYLSKVNLNLSKHYSIANRKLNRILILDEICQGLDWGAVNKWVPGISTYT